MKHQPRAHIVLIALSLFFISCSKEKKANEPTITGSWNWVSSVGGFTGSTETPASTGKAITLNITSDNKYSISTNGDITSSGTFSLTSQNCIHDHSDKQVIDFSDTEVFDLMIESMDSNDLSLSDDLFDGWVIQYHRN